MTNNSNDADTILRAIVEGRPYSFPKSSDEKAKLLDALTARATTAVLDHQTRIINRIVKAVSRETNISEEVFLKKVRAAAAKEAEKVISLDEEDSSSSAADNDADVDVEPFKKN